MIADSKLRCPAENLDRENRTAEKPAGLKAEPKVKKQSETLESLLHDIRRDAAADPLHYLLRSNTSHDGE